MAFVGQLLAHPVDDRRARAGPGEIGDTRMLGLCIRVDVDRDHAAVTEQVAQVGEEQRAAAEPRARLDDERRPQLGDDLLVDPDIEWQLPRRTPIHEVCVQVRSAR